MRAKLALREGGQQSVGAVGIMGDRGDGNPGAVLGEGGEIGGQAQQSGGGIHVAPGGRLGERGKRAVVRLGIGDLVQELRRPLRLGGGQGTDEVGERAVPKFHR